MQQTALRLAYIKPAKQEITSKELKELFKDKISYKGGDENVKENRFSLETNG